MLMNRFIEERELSHYDAIIIGGGITGCAVAYDCASRGLNVALLEKDDFGGATSAATSKLIHGGLRYLATMEFGLVRESLKERRILENIAPNLVYPIPIMVTTTRTKITNTRWVIKAGMILYDILSFDKGWTWDPSKKIPLHSSMKPEEVLKEEPNVKKEGLTGASIYYDCLSISPERLTLSFLKSATAHGAVASNYAEVTGFIRESSRITGVTVHDRLKNRKKALTGKLVINCGGPWADIVLNMARKDGEDVHLRRSEGIHVITRPLINNHIVGSITPGGRHFFVIPWRNHSLIGTTDKEYIGHPDDYRVTRESIEELLDEVNLSFGNTDPITYKDVKLAYGGLRPLVEDQTEEVYESSRKYEIYDNAGEGMEGLITVEGGKYTTSRNLAENVGNMALKKLGVKKKSSSTHKEYLEGSQIPSMKSFLKSLHKRYPDFSPETVEYLGRHYGTEAPEIFGMARADKKLAEQLTADGEILAEVLYTVRNEMARSLQDILFRRTGIGTLGHPGKKVLTKVSDLVARELRWNSSKKEEEYKEAEKIFRLPR